MTAADRLNEIEARANAATEGPWIVAIYKNECKVETKRERWHVASYASPEDAAFIARARTDVPALVAALRAVLDLADRWATQSTDYDEDTEQQIDDGEAIVRAIEEALSD